MFFFFFSFVFFVFVCWIELSNKSYLVISTRELGIPASPGRRRIPQLMNVTIAIIKTSHVFVSSSSPQHLDEKAASIVQDAPSCLSLESGGGGGLCKSVSSCVCDRKPSDDKSLPSLTCYVLPAVLWLVCVVRTAKRKRKVEKDVEQERVTTGHVLTERES